MVFFNNPEMPGGTEHILVVDDERPICELCRLMLESMGYVVSTASDPGTALELFTAQPEEYDLLITDIRMQPVSGNDLIQKIVEIRPGIPVIAHTSDIAALYTNSAIRKVVQKPASMRYLAVAVRSVLDETQIPVSSRVDHR